MTPRELAAHLQIEAEQLAAYGAKDPVLVGAAQRLGILAEAARELQTQQTLRNKQQTGTLNSVEHTQETKMRLSESRNATAKGPLAKVRKAGFTLRQLAEHPDIGVSSAQLSRVFNGINRCTPELAAAIKKVVGVDVFAKG